MPYYLAIDAGGTKTQAAVATETAILARIQGESIKPIRVGADAAATNLAQLLQQISQQAQVPLHALHSTCIGMAGLRLPGTREWLQTAIAPFVTGTVTICGDEEIALDAAFPATRGVLIIAGTGSSLLGRTRSGNLIKVGGWGPAIGDEGSGHWIGRQALTQSLHAYDRQQATPLLDAILRFWQAASVNQAVAIANQTPAPDFAQLTPLVVQTAAAGDPLSESILTQAGQWLGTFATLAAQKVQTAEATENPAANNEPPPLAYTGSVLQHIPQVLNTMTSQIRAQLPNATILPNPIDPIEGALWKARQAT